MISSAIARHGRLALVLTVAGVSRPLPAQETPRTPAPPPPPPFVLGIYYRCDGGRAARADTIVQRAFAPIIDRHAKTGQIVRWTWNRPTLGSGWRRGLFTVGRFRGALLDARIEIMEELEREEGEALWEFGTICIAHDDYLWTRVANTAVESRVNGAASLSAYYDCDATRAARADTIASRFLAPVYDGYVSRGAIASWSWLAHDFGGRFGRLGTISGPDAISLLDARDAVAQQLVVEHPRELEEFNAICASHDDYLWEVLLRRP